MNNVLAKTIDNNCPKFSRMVTEGTAKEVLGTAPEFLDQIFKSSIKSLSASIPLVYEGYRRMTPDDEYKTMVVNDISKSNYDLAISDIYAVEFIFNYNGDIIKRPIYLPYAEKGNMMKISNNVYSIVPILSDTVISPSPNEIFVRLLKDKLTFRSDIKNFIVNGEKTTGRVIYTYIVKTQTMTLKDNIGEAWPAVSIYLLGEYGFKETIRRYCKTDKIFLTDENVDDIRDEYHVYESIKIKPTKLKETGYKGHDFKVCVHKSVEVTPFLENFIFGLIYILDIFSKEEVKEDLRELIKHNNVEDEKFFWRILLGRISYRNSYSIDRISKDMYEHFDTLQGYLDNLAQSKLAETGIKINNFFDLLVVIMDKYNYLIINAKEYNSDIRNRYIDILYYIMYDIIIGFNKIILNLNKRASKKVGTLELREITKIMQTELSAKRIFTLVKSATPNLAIQLVDVTTDIMYPRITSLLSDQSCGSGVRRSNKSSIPESTKTLKGYDLYMGSLLFLTKSLPSPRFKSNLYMSYNINTGKLIIPKDIQKTIDKLDNMLTGRLEDETINVFENEDNID